MKTPREILLKRHAPMESKLDAVRKNIVAEHAGDATVAAGCAPPPSLDFAFLVRKVWRELFWPCRQFWLGTAAVWLVIAALHLSPDNASSAAGTEAAAPNRETLMALREQRRLLVQLLEPVTPSVALPAAVPPPRSEQRQTVLFA
jgi:hypothetical protein